MLTHYIPRTFLMLAVAEFLLLAAALILSFIAETESHITIPPLTTLSLKAVLYASVMLLIMATAGLYQRNLRYGLYGQVLRVIISMLIGMTVTMVLFYLLPVSYVDRPTMGRTFLFSVAGILSFRIIFLSMADQSKLQRRILVLGSDRRAATIQKLMEASAHPGFHIVGYVHMPNEEGAVSSAMLIHRDTTLLELTQQLGIDEIVVAMEDRRLGFPQNEILDCRMSGIAVIDILTFLERQQGHINLEIMQPSWLIFSDGFRYGMARIVTKRMLDIVLSFLLLLMTAPIMLLTAIAIFFESGGHGPIFYRQVRVGQNWRLFQVIKFRSMEVNAESDGMARWAEPNDRRVTRIGAFIRKTRLDELPQLFNVIIGDMSIIGPRPERPEFVEQLSARIPFYAERHRIKPGITGWAQVCYHYGGTEADVVQKLQYDLYYVKNYSLFLDLLILMKTAEVILTGQGGR